MELKTKSQILGMTKEKLVEYSTQLKREGVEAKHSGCSGCSYCYHCSGCYDCSDCYDCYYCHELIGKQYMICNVQMTPDEYKAKIKELK